MAATGWPTWTAQLAGRSAAMSTSIPVTWSTWTPRSSAASLEAVATASTGALPGWPTVAPTGVQAATTTCTLPAVDDHSHLAYVEVLDDERAQTCARFWRRAHRWFALHGITVVQVLTDNGVGYRSAGSGPHWPTTASATSAPGLIGRRPMERSSGSTGPCWRNGRSNAARRAGRSWSGWRRRPSRPEPLGTLARTLRRKWTRQRWTAAPAMVAWTTWRSPRWASAMTSCTPANPQALSERRKAVQNARRPRCHRRRGRAPRAAHRRIPGGHDHGLGDDPPVDPGLAVRWRPQTHGKTWPASDRSRKVLTSLVAASRAGRRGRLNW